MLNMQTFVISYALTAFIFILLFGVQWQYHRKRYSGPGYWLFAYVCFFTGLLLSLLAQAFSELITVLIAHLLLSFYLIFLFRGMEAFLGRKSPQRYNYAILILIAGVHYYLTYESPDPHLRQYNLWVFFTIMCLQCSWLLLRRTSKEERRYTRLLGILFAVYCANIVVRISIDLSYPPNPNLTTIEAPNSFPYYSGLVLFITIAFALNLMISRRLHLDLEKDITKRKSSESALKESEAKYKRLVESAPAIVYAFSRQRGGFYYSQGIETELGYSLEFTKKNPFFWLESVHPDDTDLLKDTIERVLRGEKLEIDYRIKNQQGDWCWIRDVTIGSYRQNDETIVEGIVYDITSFKEAERALYEKEQLYRSLFENSISVMLMIDPVSGEIIDANPEAESFYGYSRSQLIKMKIQEINTLNDKEVFDEMEKARSEKRNYFNFKHLLSDGTIRDVEVYSGPLQLGDKQLLCSIIHDISERKQANEEREKLIWELQEALQQVKTLSGLLPICASCKKIRDDKGYWSQLEIYFEAHSEVSFSHGICPQCLKRLHPKTYDKLKREGKV